MTHFLDDILRHPEELKRAFDYLCGAGQDTLQTAAAAVRRAAYVYLTGIGSSWHAALSVAPIFYRAARPVHMLDASELLQFARFPPAAVVIVISRSGRSAGGFCNYLSATQDRETFSIRVATSSFINPNSPSTTEEQIRNESQSIPWSRARCSATNWAGIISMRNGEEIVAAGGLH